TPERIKRQPEKLPVTRLQRNVVQSHSVVRVLSSHDPVEQRAFIVVGHPRISGPTEDVSGELQHVVCAAGLLGVAAQLACELTRIRTPSLAVAGPTCAVTAPARHFSPEIIGDLPKSSVTGQFISASSSDDLRDLSVDVKPFHLIAILS